MTSVRINSILALLCLLLGQKVKKRILSAVKIIGMSHFTGGLRSGTSNVKPARPAYRLSGTGPMKWFSASSFVQPENDLYTFHVSMSLLPCSDVQGKLMKYGINDLPAGIPAAVNQPEKNRTESTELNLKGLSFNCKAVYRPAVIMEKEY